MEFSNLVRSIYSTENIGLSFQIKINTMKYMFQISNRSTNCQVRRERRCNVNVTSGFTKKYDQMDYYMVKISSRKLEDIIQITFLVFPNILMNIFPMARSLI